MVRSFFSPTWKDLGVLATYGRWLGTNWVWAEWLAIYHAIFSITIPIFLVELTYPQSKTRIWLSSRMRILFHGLLVVAIILGFFAFPYDPGVLAIAGCVAAVVALSWLAKRVPVLSSLRLFEDSACSHRLRGLPSSAGSPSQLHLRALAPQRHIASFWQ